MRARVLAAVVAAGCAAGPDVVPMRGPRPSLVLVVPAAEPGGSDDIELLDAAIASMLADRGYIAIGGSDAIDKLAAFGWIPGRDRLVDLPLPGLRERFGVEAAWTSEVRDWRYERTAGLPFVFDVRGSLVSTEGSRELWAYELGGSQPAARRRTAIDPLAERDPFEADDPFGWIVVDEVLEPAELAVLVARNLGARLPRR